MNYYLTKQNIVSRFARLLSGVCRNGYIQLDLLDLNTDAPQSGSPSIVWRTNEGWRENCSTEKLWEEWFMGQECFIKWWSCLLIYPLSY